MCLFVSRAGKDCVNRLLDKSERTRLGSKSGASEVKQHKWFAKINWGLLRNTRPPVRLLRTLVCYYGMGEVIIEVADMFLADHSYKLEWIGRCELSTPEGVELAAP